MPHPLSWTVYYFLKEKLLFTFEKHHRMTIPFHKYQGTGNDFIMIDDRSNDFPVSDALISKLCNRRFGIGADGLILIRTHATLDFEMVYYNADATQSLCGNGSRCAVNFAKSLGIISDTTKFLTVDGIYHAAIDDEIVSLSMKNINVIDLIGEDYFINNGSPHHITFTHNNQAADVYNQGKSIRESSQYQPDGTNVNFVEILSKNIIHVRTYERGVENETLSCGTGVTASALAASFKGVQSPVNITTKGGGLKVSFTKKGDTSFENIVLSGPAELVFEGEIVLK